MNYRKIIRLLSPFSTNRAILTRFNFGYGIQFSLLTKNITFFVLLLLSCQLLFAQSRRVNKGKIVDGSIVKALNLTQYVNPFIGTQGTGHTFPGATTPFGLVQLSPETGNYEWQYCAGYQYKDTIIKGFSHTHLNGTGVGDLGDVLMLPYEGKREQSESSFSKQTEQAHPGYYAVTLKEGNIKVELTTTKHTGMHRYTFNQGGDSHILFDIDHTIYSWGKPKQSKVTEANFYIVDKTHINGYLKSHFWVGRQVYFSIQLNKPFKNYHYKDSTHRKLILDYQTAKGEVIEAKVGISTVSVVGASNNLKAESLSKTFETIRKETDAEWNSYLSKVLITGTLAQKQNFYTSMYHLFIQPNNIADVDGRYRGADDSIKLSPNKTYYSTLSLWDTYRAAQPLYTILTPNKDAQIVNSMLSHFDVAGYLPVWSLWGKENNCMIGNHAVPVIVDACLKGIPGIDHEKAFHAIKVTLTQNHWSKYDWTLYDKYGYLPSDTVRSEAVSRTLEAAYDDWCAAQLAKSLGKQQDYAFFNHRASFYKNLFDSTTGLMRGKKKDGSWVSPFLPLDISHNGTSDGDYTEGNAWQYTWQVQHDPYGLINLMGGKKRFAAKLDTLFSLPSTITGTGATVDVSGLIGQYAHGNEPSHHIIYLYNYAGQPYKTQKLIPQVLQSQYQNKPDGLSGNDDCGQMSAWYIFSSLGFYPVNPASGLFDIGVPAFKSATIIVGKKKFVIKAPNLSSVNKYITSMTLNGKKLNNYQFCYADLIKGGTLMFNMGNRPVKL